MDKLVDRKQLAKLLEMNPGTFWKKVLDYNEGQKILGLDGLKPDKVVKLKSHPKAITASVSKFLFDPARVPEFKTAIDSLKTGRAGRPTKPYTKKGFNKS